MRRHVTNDFTILPMRLDIAMRIGGHADTYRVVEKWKLVIEVSRMLLTSELYSSFPFTRDPSNEKFLESYEADGFRQIR